MKKKRSFGVQPRRSAKKYIDVKNVQIKIKNVEKRKNVIIKKTSVNVIKKRYLFLVQFNSTPDAQEMAFKATRNIAIQFSFAETVVVLG